MADTLTEALTARGRRTHLIDPENAALTFCRKSPASIGRKISSIMKAESIEVLCIRCFKRAWAYSDRTSKPSLVEWPPLGHSIVDAHRVARLSPAKRTDKGMERL